MGEKKVKISSVKRKAHLKSKKKSLTKSQQQKLAQAKASKDKQQNIFLQKAKKRDDLAQRKKKNKLQSLGIHEEDEDDEDIVDNVRDMLDGEDLEYLDAVGIKKNRKRKHDNNVEQKQSVGLEKNYAAETEKEYDVKKFEHHLLPIKTVEGEIITRSTEVDFKPKVIKPSRRKKKRQDNEEESKVNVEEDESSQFEDSDNDVLCDENHNGIIQEKVESKLISTVDLLLASQQEVERQKYRIGIICSGILEKPEDKMRNFTALFNLMDATSKTGSINLLKVRKCAILSVTEVFKDILPEYRVGQIDTKMQTVRKSTLERVNYENLMLQQFKKFLQKLEQLTAVVVRRGFGKVHKESIKLAEVAVISMCDLLIAHPYFNYVKNIAQLLVYMLNCNYASMREHVNQCFRHFFAIDKKLDMTLFIVRRINHLLKTKSNNVHTECLTCLIALKIKNVNLDAEKENDLKQKKLEAHRMRVINLSKKERKRKKKLNELNKELEETRAEENKQTKHHKLTEIIKMVFTIYFRILKNDPNSKVMSIILEGLAEFAHVINLDFFSDLINVLNNILETMDLGYREQLHCIHTIFVILSGQGEVLNIDPIRFYQHLYRNLQTVHGGKNHNDFRIILKTLDEVLIKRRKNISQSRLMAFLKRLITISMHLMHHGTLAALSTFKTTYQMTSVLDALLDTDCSIGSGCYDPELDDPEYCNASCTSLYELTSLIRHYHPIVKKLATHLINGAPSIGEGSLPGEIAKLTPVEYFENYDSSQMVFNPSIPVPQIVEPKMKKGKFTYAQPSFKKYYQSMLAEHQICSKIHNKSKFNFDFYLSWKSK